MAKVEWNNRARLQGLNVCVCVCAELTSRGWMCVCVHALSCLTLCDPMHCSPQGSSVHGIFQGRMLEWVAIFYSREFSWPTDQNCISCVSFTGRWILFHWATWEALGGWIHGCNHTNYDVQLSAHFLEPLPFSDSSVSIIGHKCFSHYSSHPKESNGSSAHVMGNKVVRPNSCRHSALWPTFSNLNISYPLYPCTKCEGGSTIWAMIWFGLYGHIFLLLCILLTPEKLDSESFNYFIIALCFC